MIDANYKGLVGIVLFNHRQEACKYKEGNYVAQIILEKINKQKVIEVTSFEATERGWKGLGSSSLKSAKKIPQSSSQLTKLSLRLIWQPVQLNTIKEHHS